MPSRLTRAVATWRTYRKGRVENTLPIVPCAASDLPVAVQNRLRPFTSALQTAGFVHALDCGPRERSAALLNHCSVFWLPAENIRAWVMDTEGEHAVTTTVELATRYANGTIIGTLNPTLPSIFDRPPWLRVELLPGASVEEMLASHRNRVDAMAASPIGPWDEDPLATAARENEAVLAFQAERGILSQKGRDYGYTGRGAARSIRRVADAE